jgi:lysophospholipase L1-like esterase
VAIPSERIALVLACLACIAGCSARADDGKVGALAAGGRVSFASFSHTCAAVGDGVQCWGAGGTAQLGDGLLPRRRPLPVRVAGLPGRVTGLAAGGSHSCAVSEGSLLCWGDNTRGQGGVERPFVLFSPTVVPGLPSPVERVAAGTEHTCAVAAGEVWCWGRNEAGEVGRPARPGCREGHVVRPCRTPPAAVRGIEGPVSDLALGHHHSCALAAGRVWCWGQGAPAPVAIELPGPARAIAAGRAHTCALLDDGVTCWDANGARAVPLRDVTRIAAGGDRSCAVSAEAVHCWGRSGPPERVAGLAGPVTALAMGVDHACAALAKRAVYCWGDNDYGQLGDGAAPRDPPGPVRVAAWDTGHLRDRDGDGRFSVVCLGDSNTRRLERGPDTWCEVLAGLLPAERWRLVNRGLGGATAVHGASLYAADRQVGYAVENDAPDAAILAYGTNDVRAGIPADEIVAATQALVLRLVEGGAVPFVALVPPIQPEAEHPENAQVRALNAALRRTFPEERIVDFHADMAADDYVDALHLGAAGQRKRARAAARVLEAAARVP